MSGQHRADDKPTAQGGNVKVLPCVVCGEPTPLACADCYMATGTAPHVCRKAECRDAHEALARRNHHEMTPRGHA